MELATRPPIPGRHARATTNTADIAERCEVVPRPRPAPPSIDLASPPATVPRLAPDDPMHAHPRDARQKEVEGWVALEILVGSDGRVADTRLVDRSPDPARCPEAVGFLEAVRGAVRQWQYSPAPLDDRPISVRVPIVSPFMLH